MLLKHNGKEFAINNFTFGEGVLYFDCGIYIAPGEYDIIYAEEEIPFLVEAIRKSKKMWRIRARISPKELKDISSSLDFNARRYCRVTPSEDNPVLIKVENTQQIWEYKGQAVDVSHSGISVVIPPLYEEAGVIDMQDELNVTITLPDAPNTLNCSGYFKHRQRHDDGKKYGILLFHNERREERKLYEKLSQYVLDRQRAELQLRKRNVLKNEDR